MPRRTTAAVPGSIEQFDTATGEAVLEAIAPSSVSPLAVDELAGASSALATVVMTAEETAALCAPFTDDEWDILPTGEVYVSHMRYRQRLTSVFGPGGWVMRPVGSINTDEGGSASQRWEMWVRGAWFATAIGSSRYGGGDNQRFDYADMAEAIKSNALTRMCKDFPMGADLYDRARIQSWKAAHAIEVVVRRNGESRRQWRRRDRDPLYGEDRAASPANPPAQAASAPPRQQATNNATEPRDQEEPQQAAPAPRRRASSRQQAAPAPEPAHGAGAALVAVGVVESMRQVSAGTNQRGPWTVHAIELSTDSGVVKLKLASWVDRGREMLDELTDAMNGGVRIEVQYVTETRGRFTDNNVVGVEIA